MSDLSAQTEPSPTPFEIVEALLFASDVPLEPERIREVLGLPDVATARALVDELRVKYESSARGIAISEVAGGFRMVTRAAVAPWLVRLARARTKARLSRPALETLAIVGYRQPVSRPEIDAIRGVNSDGVIENLLERRLIRVAGRKEAPGRPFLYETTKDFLVAFGLRDLGDLPKVDGELIVPEVPGEAAAPSPADVTADATEPAIGAASEAVAEDASAATTEGGADPHDAEAQAEQDPGAGGADVATRG